MSTVVIAENVRIPHDIVDLDSFRQWARSDQFPERGWFSFLRGELWVDLSKEEMFSHNLVKTKTTVALGGLVEREQLGYFFSDRMLLSNHEADLGTEPDAMFVSWDSVKSKRVEFVPGADDGVVEITGSPDMVLEVVSASSVRKDTVELRDLYWRAGIKEYWLVDARDESPHFALLRHAEGGYQQVEAQEGWVESVVYQARFRAVRSSDPLGNPQVELKVR